MIIPTRSYDDIIALPRPESTRRMPMPLPGRAAQFAPFAALTGFDEEIDETARLTDRTPEQTEEDLLRLNSQLCELQDCLHEQPEVALTVFKPDEKKPGGAYIRVTGRLRQIDATGLLLLFTDGRHIPFSRLHSITRLPPRP